MKNAVANKMIRVDQPLALRLDRAFKSAWRSYCQAFKSCQKKLSRKTVHQLRVETRRLLALVDLFEPLLDKDRADKVSRLFKPPFKSSGRVRDMQVISGNVEGRLRRFPEAKRFSKELLRRKKRLCRRLEQRLCRTRLKPLKNGMNALRKELCAAVKPARGHPDAGVRLRKGVDRTFANVVALRRHISPARPSAIHRTRIALKKFRYMAEQLQTLMPGVAGRLPGKLRGYQKLMGDIQDCETLLAALDKYLREDKDEIRRLHKFRASVKREHAARMARYLRRADELFAFWKPVAKSPSARTRH